MCQVAELFHVCEANKDEKMPKEEKLDAIHCKAPPTLFNADSCANHLIFRLASQNYNKFNFKDVPEVPKSMICSRKTAHRIYHGYKHIGLCLKATAQVNLDAPTEVSALVKLQPTDMECKQGHEFLFSNGLRFALLCLLDPTNLLILIHLSWKRCA